MSAGRVLHLRCFLEGAEIPIISCSVSAQTGSAASAHIEILDSELAFELLPRTIVHVFYYDHMDGKNPNPPEYTYGSFVNSSSYKMLFCGEIFSVFHNKSGFGSRSLTIMALDFSNILDTNYIFQVSYTDATGVMSLGDQAEAAFIAGQSIGNNPFDNIVNTPSVVISHMIKQKALSANHVKRVSKIGGMFALFEMLLGVDRYSMGMNIWVTIHEKMTRFLDMIDSDNGYTSQNLFTDSVFEEWVEGQVGTQAPSQSFRQLSDMILSYVYYRFTPIPTASYRPPLSPDLSGREEIEIVDHGSGGITPGPAEYSDYVLDINQAGGTLPDLLDLAVEIVKDLRGKGYPGTVVTDSFRPVSEGYGYLSPHSQGRAIDIDSGVWPDVLPGYTNAAGSPTYDRLFGNRGHPNGSDSNIALSRVRFFTIVSGSMLEYVLSNNEDTRNHAESQGWYTPDGDRYKVSDGQIIHFFLNKPPTPQDVSMSGPLTDEQSRLWTVWVELAEIYENLLFGGVVKTPFQFLNWILVYPLMRTWPVGCPCQNYWVQIHNTVGTEGYLTKWKTNWSAEGIANNIFNNNNPAALLTGMRSDCPAMVWFRGWLETYTPFFKTILQKEHGVYTTQTDIGDTNDGLVIRPTDYYYESPEHLPEIGMRFYRLYNHEADQPRLRGDYISFVRPDVAPRGDTTPYYTGSDIDVFERMDVRDTGLPFLAGTANSYDLNVSIGGTIGFSLATTYTNETFDNLVYTSEDTDSSWNLIFTEDALRMGELWYDYWEKKKAFWNEYYQSFQIKKAASPLNASPMLHGVVHTILTYGPPIYGIFGIAGDDPVHFQIQTEAYNPETGVATVGEAEALYDDKETLVGFLATPDIWMAAAPKCNVIFPEEIMSLNVSRELMRQTSRVFLMTYDRLLADNIILNAHYFAPQFEDVDSISQISFGANTGHEVVYPHEVFSGIIPKVSKMSEISFYSRARQDDLVDEEINDNVVRRAARGSSTEQQVRTLARSATSGVVNAIESYATNVAHFNLLRQRYASTRISITGKFMDRLVPGLPGVVIGKQKNSKNNFLVDTQTWLGTVEAVQHSYTQAGASTSVTLSVCRPYNTGENSIDELAKLKKDGSILFTNQDPENIVEFSRNNAGRETLISFFTETYIDTFPSSDSLEIENIGSRLIEKFGVSLFSEGPTADTESIFKKDVETAIDYIQAVNPTVSAPGAKPPEYQTAEHTVQEIYGDVEVTTYGTSYRDGVRTEKTEVVRKLFKRIITFEGSADSKSTNTNARGLPLSGEIIIDYTNGTSVSGSLFLDFSSLFPAVLEAQGYPANITDATSDDLETQTQEFGENIAERIEDEMVTDNPEDYLITVGGVLKQVSSVVQTDQVSPFIGHYIVSGQRPKSSSTHNTRNFIGKFSTSRYKFSDPSAKDNMRLEISIATDGDTLLYTGKYPVLVHMPEFFATITNADLTPASTTTSALKQIPLEEALMPPWVDNAYKNGVVDPVTNTIKKDSGIGVVYRQWFDCDSILDGRPYIRKDKDDKPIDPLYSTVTVEQAVGDILSKYENGAINVYSYTKRNIATLHNMLSPVKEEERSETDVFYTGGFHSRAVGSFSGFEGLGVLGDLKPNVSSSTPPVTISSADIEGLDPRAERLKRVKLYKDYVLKTRGKLG